jgi:Tfp pilus assembly protein PilO
MIQVPVPPMPPTGNFDPDLVVLVFLAALAAATIILWPIMRALARRLEAKGGTDPVLKDELDQMHHRLAEMEPLQARMAELEERLDFAERLLAQAKDPERLPR